jgi:TetR/AcrR family transcriptional repressor of nem operon
MAIVIIIVKTPRFGTFEMRVSKEQAAKNRERILDSASRLMRERGISGVGVDALTEAAGMTHGSLYSQFGSKERLVEEAVAYAIAAKGQEVPEAFALGDYVSEYLSAAHRDQPGNGCPFAALCCEMPRQGKGVRERFTAGVRGVVGLLSGRMDSGLKPRQREEKALATIASLVGALVLARAVNDPKLSNDILRATRNGLSD